jgi:excisionase family DNA binding protein
MQEKIQNDDSREPRSLWNVEAAARFLNISTGTLYHWVSARRINCLRFGNRCLRFDAHQLQKWVGEHQQAETTANNHTRSYRQERVKRDNENDETN